MPRLRGDSCPEGTHFSLAAGDFRGRIRPLVAMCRYWFQHLHGALEQVEPINPVERLVTNSQVF